MKIPLPPGKYDCTVLNVHEVVRGRNDGAIQVTIKLDSGEQIHQVMHPESPLDPKRLP